MRLMDIVKKVIKFLIFPLLVRIPGYRMIAQKVCKICNPRKGTLSKLISMSFWNNCYFQLPPGERMDMQLLLMGGDEGVGWAQKYQVKEHLESGRSKVGALDFLDACPAFDRISRF